MPLSYDKTRVLYISYDGILEPLGQSQVLSYLQGLSSDFNITLISFEKKSYWTQTAQRQRIKKTVQEAGIQWVPLRYHKRPNPLVTLYDVLSGIIISFFLVIKHKIRIIHARSYIASLIALPVSRLLPVKFIFDMRGFWADERVERGIWEKKHFMYTLFKNLERHYFIQSDIIISLTQSGVDRIKEFPFMSSNQSKFHVIPTCTQLNFFRPMNKGEINQNDKNRPFSIGHVGSVDTAYLFEPVLEVFKILKDQYHDTKLTVLNRGAHAYIKECLEKHSISDDQVVVKEVEHQLMPEEMNKMDVGIFFIKPGFAIDGSLPTKLGEFLACGKPCLCGTVNRDVDQILEKEKVGVIVKGNTKQDYDDAVRSLIHLIEDPDLEQRCRKTAEKYFSLESGIKTIKDIYRSLSMGSS
jgi:glycosyltransferase involved in cell wall biosynthesis